MQNTSRNPLLYKYSKTAGCAAKYDPSKLLKILESLTTEPDGNLLTGFYGNEDAAVYKLTEEIALVFTIDVIAPPVDDPNIFGQIAAANSISDIYAMGGHPFLCLSILCLPEEIDCIIAKEILAGANQKIKEASALLVGGHTVRSENILFGLAVIGRITPTDLWRNCGAQEGDSLILTKPIGSGVLFSALRGEVLAQEDISDAVQWSTTLNRTAAETLRRFEIHAVTDITGFGLLGHALEMAKGAHVTFQISEHSIPIMKNAIEMYDKGIETGITAKNISFVYDYLHVSKFIPYSNIQLLHDPQTNGGLLISVLNSQALDVVQALKAVGLNQTKIIGRVLQFDKKHLVLE